MQTNLFDLFTLLVRLYAGQNFAAKEMICSYADNHLLISSRWLRERMSALAKLFKLRCKRGFICLL
jgi:hypothetical protein